MSRCIYILIIFLFFSCKKEEESSFSEDYGAGMYILTNQGISFFNGAQVESRIYNKVNNKSIFNLKKIKFSGDIGCFINDNQITVVDANTFEDLGSIKRFNNPVDFDFVYGNRILVADKDISKVREVDLAALDIISTIETGDSTKPTFLISNSFRSFVMNSGMEESINKDSTVISIDFVDGIVPIANFSGNMIVGDNPNSAVINDRVIVLSGGVNITGSTANNTESSITEINQYTNAVYNTTTLSGIFNASNLVKNYNGNILYFTDDNAIYSMSVNNYIPNTLLNIRSNILRPKLEQVSTSDTSFVYYDMLYMNDLDNPNVIYKYNLDLSIYEDSIYVDGSVIDFNFYK